MTGSVQSKNGRWYAVLNLHVNGKRKQKWVKTGLPAKGNKRNAQKILNRLLMEYELLQTKQAYLAGAGGAFSEMPLFHDYLENWLESRRMEIEVSTWESYEIYVKVHLAPWFKAQGLRVNEVSPRHVKKYLNDKFYGEQTADGKTGLSINSLKKHKSIISMAFCEAITMDRLVEDNPVDSVPLPRDIKNKGVACKAVFLNIKEANQMLRAFLGHELYPVVYITLCYGLRRSEVLGLKWNAVDLEGNTLRIQHTVVKHKKIVAKDRTKSKTGMGVPYELLPEVREILIKLKAEQEQYCKIFGNTWKATGYVFVRSDGSPRRPDCVTRGFQRVLKNNGLKHMRFHDLRHSTASILHDKGWNLKDIQEWLRHSDIKTTANIYMHVSNEHRKMMTKDLEGTFHPHGSGEI